MDAMALMSMSARYILMYSANWSTPSILYISLLLFSSNASFTDCGRFRPSIKSLWDEGSCVSS